MSDELDLVVMDEAAARRLTEKIRITAHTYAEARDKLIGYVEEAKNGNAHIALGYASWTGYLSEVLGEEPMRLARDERREVVALLSAEGMSTRDIAPIVGVSHDTVHKDIQAIPPVRNLTPDPEPGTYPQARKASWPERKDAATIATREGVVIAEQYHVDVRTGEILDEAPAPAPKIIGRDGKQYTRPEPKVSAPPRKPPRRAITDQFFDAAFDAVKKIESVYRLTEDDRFPQNAKKIAAKHRNDLLRASDLLHQVINSLDEIEDTP